MPVRIDITDRGHTNNFFRGTFVPGIYFSEQLRRDDDTNSLLYRFELINKDVNISGTPGTVTLYVQSRAYSSENVNWRTIFTSDTHTIEEADERMITLNMDVFRFKMVVTDSTVEVDLNGTNQHESHGNQSFQVNFPDKIMAGNESPSDLDLSFVYTTGPGGATVVDKVYKYPKGSVSGDRAIELSFTYNALDKIIKTDKNPKGILP